MKYEGKDCKKFITKMVKLINSFNKYNVESILLMQIFVNNKTGDFEPVIMSRPINVNVFEYVKRIYADDEVYSRSIEFINMESISKKIDKLHYSPVIFGSLSPISFMKMNMDDIRSSETLLPSSYSIDAKYSDSYFIVTDLFKKFIKERPVCAIDNEFRFYSDLDTMYDTSEFLYPNKVSDTFKIDFIEDTSPVHFLPIDSNDKKENFINKHVREILIKLNNSVINLEIKEAFSFRKDIGLIEKDSKELVTVDENIKKGIEFHLKNDYNSIVTYPELFKIKPKEIVFTSKEVGSNIYAGIGLITSGCILYIVYKYFKYGEDM
ncbi:MAG: hypothetical protein ACRC5M_06645 [Anaeroplasmataceae bacterium]